MNTTYSDLAGKVVLITGGSRGIGAQTARAFAAQGAKVCVVGRDSAALKSVVAGMREAGGTAVAVTADVTYSESLASVRAELESQVGSVDVLAGFAGGQGFPVTSVQMTEQHWRNVLDSEVTSAFLTIQEFLPGMISRGAGSIITMSSTAGRQPGQANLAYAVAKAGVVMLTRHLATELGPSGIRVNCIAPSSIRTEKLEANMPAAMQETVLISEIDAVWMAEFRWGGGCW